MRGLVVMISVARAGGVTIHCPVDGKYAFYNSPYPAHHLSTAIDIYPNREFDEVAPSPVDGVVELVRRVRSPRGRSFEDPGYDIVTLLRSLEDPRRIIKLLHIEPVIECGDTVEAGQELGRLLRSGYFGFGTSPHIHLEIRDPSDPLRARGGHPVKRLMEVVDARPTDELRGVVTRSIPEFSIIKMDDISSNGLPANVGGVSGLLDGGIPYYGWLGAHVNDEPPTDNTVTLLKKPIAIIKNVLSNVCLADCLEFVVKVDGIAIQGISLHLSPRKEVEVKLIPLVLGSLKLEEDVEVSLTLE